MTDYKFRLYVRGGTAQSQRALFNLRAICEAELAGRYEIELIDALEQPGLVAEAGIFVLPTLVTDGPTPRRRIIGDLSDRERVISALIVPQQREQRTG